MTESAQTRSDSSEPPAMRHTLAWLVNIMRRLLGPDGCPWDREQTLETLRPFLVEESYEVLDAIDSGDRDKHCEELGDLLLQIVFQSELATIGMDEIIRAIGEKLIRRHPHVFGAVQVRDADEVVTNWEAIKAAESNNRERRSVLDGIPRALPALHWVHELTRKAARKGGSQSSAKEAAAQVVARVGELSELTPTEGLERPLQRRVGDLLFAVADWARLLGIEPEQTLRDAGRRFEREFRSQERHQEENL